MPGQSVHDMPANFTGTWYVWRENGGIAAKYEYRDGSPYGLRREWNDNGVLILEETWHGMTVVGLYREWYDNGQLRHQIEYDNNGTTRSAMSWHADHRL